LKHSSGEQESFSPNVLAQEAGELLGQAMSHCKQIPGGDWQDQEAWGLTIHGTEVRLLACLVTKKYLSYLCSPFMRDSEHLVIFRSEPFNLKLDEERPKALKAVMALLLYLKSGKANIALLRLALS
jgi:hypothetical protein